MLARFRCAPALVALALLPRSAAAVTIDGWFDPGEGYVYHATIQANTHSKTDPNVELAPVSPADAYFFQDPLTKDLSIAIVLPVNYTDNTFGAASSAFNHTHMTWYSGTGGSMGNSDQAHTFKDLEKSDHAAFLISRNATEVDLGSCSAASGDVSCFGIDYLFETSRNSGVFTSGPATDGGGDPDGVLVEAATSIDFNVNTFTPIGSDGPFTGNGSGVSPELADPSNTSSYATLHDYSAQHIAGWIMENVYEFTISGDSAVIDGNDVVDGSGFINGFDLLFKDLHASPSKKNTATAFEETEPTFTPIPEPDPAALLGLGLLAFAARRQARHRRADSR